MVGVYNKLTKDYKYLYRNSVFTRGAGGWSSVPVNLEAYMYIEMQGKAGSYRDSVFVNISHVTAGTLSTNAYSAIAITTKWSFYEKGISSLSNSTLLMVNPTFGANTQEPVTCYLGNYMYLTVIPFKYVSGINNFNFQLNGVHMPYTYDLPDYRIYVMDSNTYEMRGYN